MTGPWGYGGGSHKSFWRCHINAKPGWYCTRPFHLDGPCALVPKWWNLREHLRTVGRVW